MAPFWRQNQLVWTQIKELKGEFMIWRTKWVHNAIKCRFGVDYKLPMGSYCRQYEINVKSFL
jgi:hypothetical protein